MQESIEHSRTPVPRPRWWLLALVPIALGFALRLLYVLQAEPFVDEPTTLLAAQAIARSGVPILPSGFFYGNDLLYAFLTGGLVAIVGPSLTALRLFSLALSVVTIGLVCQAGKRLISPSTGIWAGILLALSTPAIVWGGRARAYALLQLVVFLALWLFYEGVTAERNGLRRLGLLLLALSIFIHPEATLLVPALVVAVWLVEGWRWWFQPSRILELAALIAAALSRFWLQTAVARGQVSGTITIDSRPITIDSRPILDLAGDWAFRLQRAVPFFLEPQRLPWTLLALTVLVVAGAAALRQRRIDARSRPILFFSVCLWLVPVEMVLLLGDTYQSPRYLYMLLPVFALMVAAGLDWLVALLGRLGRFEGHSGLVAGLGALVLLAAYGPSALGAPSSEEKGFRSAFEYVEQHWQPGDRLATVAPAYGDLVSGQGDFFTLGLDYEEFVFRGMDGRWRDRWLGLPLIRSAEELEAVLDLGQRLWFVTDESRLRKRFDSAFAQAVWQRMELVSRPQNAMVFVSSDTAEPSVSRLPGAPLATFGVQIELAGYDLGGPDHEPPDAGWGQVVAQPGEDLPLTLYWRAAGPISGDYTVFVHLLGPDGERVAQDDGPPLKGLQPMAHWLAGEVLPDRRSLELPEDVLPGQYRLEVGLYGSGGGDRLPVANAAGTPLGEALTLDYVRIVSPGAPLPTPERPSAAELGAGEERLRLLGYNLPQANAAPGDALRLTLYWQALDPIQDDYTVFVHLLAEDGQIRGQGDSPPLYGFQPTSLWDPGEVIVDEHTLVVDTDALPGTYRLVAGLYLLSTGQRLAGAGGDQVFLGEVQVEP